MVTRLPFPFFGAVAAFWFAPDYLTRERQEFKEEGHSFNPRTAREQCLASYGQTAGVPFSLPPRRAPRRSRHPQAAHPSLRFSENSPPRQGEHAYAVRAPRLSGAGKSCRPLGRTCLRSSCAPVNRCRKRVPPRMDEPPARFVHLVKRAPCKSKFPKENPHAIG